jgi:hypothetical protein
MEQPVVEDGGVRRRTNGRMTADIWRLVSQSCTAHHVGAPRRPWICVCFPNCRNILEHVTTRRTMKSRRQLIIFFFRLLRCNIFYWPTYESARTLAQVCRLHQRWICGELEAKKDFYSYLICGYSNMFTRCHIKICETLLLHHSLMYLCVLPPYAYYMPHPLL